jgi:hypothetical protein
MGGIGRCGPGECGGMSTAEGEWVSWSIDGRAGAKLCLGPVFLGEISYPHDMGLGARWRAWLNHEHLGFFRNAEEAKSRIEGEVLKRLRLMEPAWAKFQARAQASATTLEFPPVAVVRPGSFPQRESTAPPSLRPWPAKRNQAYR